MRKLKIFLRAGNLAVKLCFRIFDATTLIQGVMNVVDRQKQADEQDKQDDDLAHLSPHPGRGALCLDEPACYNIHYQPFFEKMVFDEILFSEQSRLFP